MEKPIIFSSTKSCASVYQILYQKSQECQWANESRDKHFPLLENVQHFFLILISHIFSSLYSIGLKQWQNRDRRKYQEKQRTEAMEIEFGTIG